ncbi:MAG: laccase domain-containing protein [Candidatus Hydrogenedentes bacterium]|jgi:YfiH family protein|nr:laccase domain-containing protein [Candidatus Hydrogenedentota bacterium]
MIRFPFLEEAGLSAAFISDKSDGDCSIRPEAEGTARRLLDPLGIDIDLVYRLRQVHGNHILDTKRFPALMGREKDYPEADGMITTEPGTALGISVADCAPVILFDPEAQVLAALHAGREGTLCNIAGKAVNLLVRDYACSVASIKALIGPCAGVCCYEVSESCAAQWQDQGLPRQGRYLDLGQANQSQLETAGLIRHNIVVVPHCTVCGDLFFSYRSGEISNRNLVVVML